MSTRKNAMYNVAYRLFSVLLPLVTAPYLSRAVGPEGVGLYQTAWNISYIFCLAFPLVMLGVMTLVNESIPKESGMTVFRIDNLSAGVAVFGQTFVMLFSTTGTVFVTTSTSYSESFPT